MPQSNLRPLPYAPCAGRQPVVVPMLLVATLLNPRGYQAAPKADGPHGGRVAPSNWHRGVMQGLVVVANL